LEKLVNHQKSVGAEIEKLMLRWTYLNELDEEIDSQKNN
jgi:ATP-binding cassette subfamily F protein uup